MGKGLANVKGWSTGEVCRTKGVGMMMECGPSLTPVFPDGLVLCHLPHGPTAHFTLSGAVLRHEVGGSPRSTTHLAAPTGQRAGTSGKETQRHCRTQGG